MAERPIFVSTGEGDRLVKEILFQIKWHPGFAPVQKERNIRELHQAAERSGFGHLLEISTKSRSLRGQHLSAFYVKVRMPNGCEIPLECAFQGSKIFERGGPSFVLAHREYESWFLAAAESLAGRRGLRPDLLAPQTPEDIRDAKGWLSKQIQGTGSYSPTQDQGARSQWLDLSRARLKSRSFRKFWKEIEAILRMAG